LLSAPKAKYEEQALEEQALQGSFVAEDVFHGFIAVAQVSDRH
jgi:hypothetical protein